MLQRPSGQLPPVTVHLDTPSVARVYDYFLGGMTNWEVDRSFADQVLHQFPIVRRIAFAHRLFLNRAVRYLMKQGIRQFLDVGSGVPNLDATHAVADEWSAHNQEISNTRVVLVDNDPVAVAHTELFLDREGDRSRHAVINADLRDPEALWQSALDTGLLDPGQPTALLLVGVLHLRQLDADGADIGLDSTVKLRELLPIGSYLAVSHVSDQELPKGMQTTLGELKDVYNAGGANYVVWRSHTEIESVLRDCHMVEPGWTSAVSWRPEETGPEALPISFPPDCEEIIWAGVGQKL